MWLQCRGEGRKGFSVVEMMVVVVIIGILAQLGLSRYRVMTAKSKQSEAKLNLSTIEELQELYFLEYGTYKKGKHDVGLGSDCANDNLTNQLGFRPKDCEELRYKYSWKESVTKEKATATSTAAEGEEEKFIYPGCDKIDQWTVTYEKGRISNTINAIDECK